MKPLTLILVLITSLAYAQGSYRWDVKIGIDTAGQRVFKMKAKATTISALTSKEKNPRPEAKEKQKGLRATSEKRKVTVTANMIGLGEEPDGDYHLILKALRSKTTLVGEIPNPAQPKLSGFPSYKNLYGTARDNVDNDIQKPTKTIKEIEPVKVIVTGYLFFDIFEEGGHGNGSALENAIEIHPILTVKIVK